MSLLSLGANQVALSWVAASGCALRSAFSAAGIAQTSAVVGMRKTGNFDAFDIAIHLPTIGLAQSDDSSRFATIDERNAVEGFDRTSKIDLTNINLKTGGDEDIVASQAILKDSNTTLVIIFQLTVNSIYNLQT